MTISVLVLSTIGVGIRVGIGQVAEEGSRLIVSFSVTSSKSEPVELVPPQVQLSGQSKYGIFRRSHWTTVQQLPVETYQMSHEDSILAGALTALSFLNARQVPVDVLPGEGRSREPWRTRRNSRGRH